MRDKFNPFHGHFTVKIVRFRLSKLMNKRIEITSSCLCVQKLKSFARKTDFFFLSPFSMLGVVHYSCLILEIVTLHSRVLNLIPFMKCLESNIIYLVCLFMIHMLGVKHIVTTYITYDL